MDQEELIRQILDGELTSREEGELRAEASGGDSGFEDRLQRARVAQQALGRLPPVPPPEPGLTQRIMEALPPDAEADPLLRQLPQAPPQNEKMADRVMASLPTPSRQASWWRVLVRPIPVPAWALVLLVAAGVTWVSVDRQHTPLVAPAAQVVTQKPRTAPPKRPEPPRPMLVRFHLAAPAARKVSLVADFNGWSTQKTMLSDPDGNGIWTVTVPLSSGRYHYRFLVNGEQWVMDPDATSFLADGFGGTNALLDI